MRANDRTTRKRDGTRPIILELRGRGRIRLWIRGHRRHQVLDIERFFAHSQVIVHQRESDRANWPDEPLDPIEAIKARMANSGRTRKDFEKIVGSSGRASEILNRKRHLTLPMIWRLVHDWKMSADVLVRPYELVKRPKSAA